MVFGLTMGTDRATALQSMIENELVKRGLGTEPGELELFRFSDVQEIYPARKILSWPSMSLSC